MKVKIKIDPPMTNPGVTWIGTTFVVSRDKDFNTIDLTSEKLSSNGDDLDTLVIQIDANVKRVYVKNTITLSNGVTSTPSSPIVIDKHGRSTHAHDALLLTPTLIKDGVFDFDNDVTLKLSPLEHMKRSPELKGSSITIYDTDSIPFFEESRDTLISELTVNKSVCAGRNKNLLTAGGKHSTPHNDTSIGEVILNDLDFNYDISLEGKLFHNSTSLLFIKTNAIATPRFSYELKKNGVTIDTGVDNNSHILIRSMVPIEDNADYVLVLEIFVANNASISAIVTTTSTSNNFANMSTDIVTADINNISIVPHIISSVPDFYNGRIGYGGKLPLLESTTINMCSHNIKEDGTIQYRSANDYIPLVTVQGSTTLNKSTFKVVGDNRQLAVYVTNSNTIGYSFNYLNYNDSGSSPESNLKIQDGDLGTFKSYTPNASIETENTFLTAFVNVNDGISIYRGSLSNVAITDTTFDITGTGITTDPQLHNTGINTVVLTGKDSTGKIVVCIYNRNLTNLISTEVLDLTSDTDILFVPTINNLESINGVSGVFFLNESNKTRQVEYPITGQSVNKLLSDNAKVGVVVDKDKIILLET